MKPVIDHIQITVRDLELATPFYDRMLEIMGFDVSRKVSARIEAHDFSVVEYPHPDLAFAITSPREKFKDEEIHRRKPGSMHHLAFKAGSKGEVDALHEQLLAMDAPIVGGPKYWPEHGADYYAVFFKDLEGLKYEIVFSPEGH